MRDLDLSSAASKVAANENPGVKRHHTIPSGAFLHVVDVNVVTCGYKVHQPDITRVCVF